MLTFDQIKERLRGVPHRGVGYGALRYLGGDRALGGAARPQLSFNYLGQFDQVLSGGEGLFRPGRESAGRMASPRNCRSHLLQVNGSIAGGRLRMDFSYGESAHRRETVEALARAHELGEPVLVTGSLYLLADLEGSAVASYVRAGFYCPAYGVSFWVLC